jgi:hypothetical protein
MGVLNALERQSDLGCFQAKLEHKGAKTVGFDPEGNLGEILGQHFVRKNVQCLEGGYCLFFITLKQYFVSGCLKKCPFEGEVWVSILARMAEGNAVTIVPIHVELNVAALEPMQDLL